MIIVSQDRDMVIHTHKNMDMKGEAVYYKHKPLGYNLIIDNKNVGTFDTEVELYKEMINICQCYYKVYCISGFVDYNNSMCE